MKNIKEMLDAVTEPITLDSNIGFSNFLTEESDFEENKIITEDDDPFANAGANDAGGGDLGGGDTGGDAGNGDPFGSNDGGSDPFGGGGNGGGEDGAGGEGGAAEGEGEDDEQEDPDANPALTDGSHKPDPEFNQGETDSDDVTLSKTPAISSKFNITDIMQTVASVIQTLSEDQLVEIEKVKSDIELIFNGFLLNDEDLEFENVENAIFLIEKVAEKLDIKVKNYLLRKFKEPLIKKRDAIKQDIATKKGELNTTRDILTKLDTKV
jgi:hypothetical protein